MNKTMLDILQGRLIDGLTIKKTKELASKWKITFEYQGEELCAELPKACTPGYHNRVADHTIVTVMSAFYINHCEYQKAKQWLDKLINNT